MRIILATDAWFPQINGVVRTLSTTVEQAEALGHTVRVIGPDRFRTLPAPGYPQVRLALAPGRLLARLMDEFAPDAVHIPVEGPIGLAARRHCLRRGWPFTTSFHTRFGDYFAAKLRLPPALPFAFQRWFHNAGAGFMVQTATLEHELAGRGFRRIRRWGRAVDTELFQPPRQAADRDVLGLPRPVFLNVGRVSTEKNLEAFLTLDLPGSKVVVGDGPQRAAYQARHPDVHFPGWRSGADLTRYFAAADVFVFPSRFETLGLVTLESLACGTPVAAYPVPGPRDVIGDHPVGVLDEDLRAAALRALSIPRDRCRAFALGFSWRRCTEEFLGNLVPIMAPARFAAVGRDGLQHPPRP
ncbi:glycosyltransferase family 4 protein [Oleisolibacter albus]|uniref:glycosyltransferase family 4 protein n=1 Tax=Oleisolibacter albus TaxID=2171757 RepID=UPI000DF366FB|nr:glycosyltransferase family 1 protein [Oleisolibacter albus]